MLLVYALEKTTYRECHVVQTVEDDVVETVENFSFSLQHFTGDPLVRVQPSQITFRVIDDDSKKELNSLQSSTYHFFPSPITSLCLCVCY